LTVRFKRGQVQCAGFLFQEVFIRLGKTDERSTFFNDSFSGSTNQGDGSAAGRGGKGTYGVVILHDGLSWDKDNKMKRT